MKKLDISVDSLVDMIDRRELQLPEIQRRYVWRAPRVRDLLDSLYRGYPSGSILVWDNEVLAPARDLQVHEARSTDRAPKLLLDGQQRLTSLTAVIKGYPIHVRGRKRPIDVLFNLEHPDGPPSDLVEVEATDDAESLPAEGDDPEDATAADSDDGEPEEALQEKLQRRTFVVASKALEKLPNWVSVTEVFKSFGDKDILHKAGISSFEDPRYEKYTDRLRRLRQIRQYMYVMHLLEREISYEEVAEIFVRVNSLGVKLRSSDLALAQITARWPGSLQLFEGFQQQCEESGFPIELGLIVRAIVVFASRQATFKTVGSITTVKLKGAWEEAKLGIEYAINFLRNNARIEVGSLLSSPFLMVPIAVFSQLRRNNISSVESRDLLYWLLVAHARGRYSRGSSEGLLNEDLAVLFRGEQVDRLIETLRLQFGRLHIESADLAGRGQQSPLFPLAFLALKAAGAMDWHSGLGISRVTQLGRKHEIQVHHIFPKSLLKKSYEKSEINEMANLAFISGQTNQRLGNKEPAEYFPEIMKNRPEALFSQLIPTDPSLHTLARYRDFLAARREALSQAMNAHLEEARR